VSDDKKKGPPVDLRATLRASGPSQTMSVIHNLETAEIERRRRDEIDRALREGRFPQTRRRAVKQGDFLPVPKLFLRVPLFRYSHRAEYYGLENPMRLETSWGICNYVGKPLTPFHLLVLAVTIQLAGTNYLKSPRKYFHQLRLIGSKNEAGDILGHSDKDEVSDDYELMECIFGSVTITDITARVFGSVGGYQVNRTRQALLELWDGRFYTQPRNRTNQNELSDWFKYTPDDPILQDDAETDISDDENVTSVSPAMRAVIGHNGDSKKSGTLRRFPFFDIDATNSLNPRGNIKFLFSPLLTQLLDDGPTYIDLKAHREFMSDGLAQQLMGLIESQTNPSDPSFKIGYDKLMDAIGYELVQKKKDKNGNIVEYRDKGSFVREINKKLTKLKDSSFLADWKVRPLLDKSRKSDLIDVTRRFTKDTDNATDDQSDGSTKK